MDNMPRFQPGRRTLFGWLRETFESRTLAEMSVWYCIIAAGGLVTITLILGSIGGPAAALPALVLWPIFLVWLWVALVRIAWRSGPARMETSTFKYMQIAFAVTTLWTVFTRADLSSDYKIITFLLLTFDAVVMSMALVFLLLAWCSRSKVPWRTYREIVTMSLIFAFQIYLTHPAASR